jgi:nucleoid-associated protein YgaU
MMEKAYLVSEKDSSFKVSFMFNPNEITFEKSNQYSETQTLGLPSSTLQFIKGGVRTLTMDLFFDTYEKHESTDASTDVRTITDKITGWDSRTSGEEVRIKGLMDIDSELHAPPICLFVWGSLTFRCIIERVTKKFTMFLPTGIPVRATLNVTLKEFKDIETQLKETSLHSTDRTKVWHVKRGDTLWLIAAEEYGDPGLWRPIAEKNKIYDPRVLQPGKDLVIPPLE